MKLSVPAAREIVCRIGYVGELFAHIDPNAPPIVQPFTVKVFLEPVRVGAGRAERKGVGEITFGLFRPLNFPGVEVADRIDVDLTRPMRRAWDVAAGEPSSWLRAMYAEIRPEFLAFGSIEIAPKVAGRRIALAVMAEIINRHVAPGGIVLLNPYPLEFLVPGARKANSTPEERQHGVAALKRHYSRLGLRAIETEPDLMVLQRPSKPITGVRSEVRLTLAEFDSLADVASYEGLY